MSPQGSFDPVRLRHSAWKKRAVGWLDRWCLRRAAAVHVTSEAERGWVGDYCDHRPGALTRPGRSGRNDEGKKESQNEDRQMAGRGEGVKASVRRCGIKRVFDVAVVALTAVVWVPLLLLAALAVLAGMGRPVFFRQERAGLGGRTFRLVKLRTMREGDEPDAERLTRVGRWLRATSLDELPELWNVLRGEMSLVGPRPLPVRYLPRYSPQQARRHEVRPGITGWAQVNGRNTLTWEEKFAYDVWYVDHRSLWLDVKILWLTVWQVLARRGISAEGEATMGELLRPPSGRNGECKNGRGKGEGARRACDG